MGTAGNDTLLAVAGMSLRKDVRVALNDSLNGAKTALSKNRLLQACSAMNSFDSSVAFFLSKGKLTASQGRQLNTASKDITAAIGCQ